MNRAFLALPVVLALAVAGCATPPRLAPVRVDPDPAPAAPAPQGDDAEALAKKLSNPVAALVSVPFQLNYDDDIGPGDGQRWTLNVQPVVPITLNDGWNVISRTILPILSQEDIPPGKDKTGIGDIVQSFFFSPKAPTASGWIWGAGPVLLLPTATDETLGGEKWGLGPTVVALQQSGPWTYGVLANHIWSVAGDDGRDDISTTFVQPFASYTDASAVTYTLNSESTYDWKRDDAAIPLNAVVTKVVKLGGQLFSVGGGVRYWVEDSDASPEGLGFRLIVTLLLPK